MNILLINADQLRYDCLGYMGLRDVKTPNLDALARDGIVYECAYTPLPVCSPARQALLCGRRPDSFGAQWNYDFIPTPPLEPGGCWPIELRDAGWNTGYIGRFHVSKERAPEDFGYREFADKREYRREIAEKYPDARYEGGWLGCESPIPVEDSETHWMAARAEDMLRRFAASGDNWHIWLDFEVPHLPCRPSPPYSKMYDPENIPPWDGWGDTLNGKPYIQRQQTLSWNTEHMEWSEFQPMVAYYFGWITQLDDAIGRVVRALDETGQAEDTIVVFTSDHGDMCASHSMLDKHYVLYDDIIRVPLIARVPGAAARRSKAFVMNCLDIPASIRDWAGLRQDSTAHGRKLPLTEEDDAACPDEVFVSSNGQQFGLYTARALRTRTHKYVWNLTDIDEFYDLRADPGEKRNLIAQPEFAETISGMRKRLHALLTQSGDPFAGNEWTRRQLLEDRIHIPAWAKDI